MKKTILLIEKDEKTCSAEAGGLKKTGYTVILAHSGEDALEKINSVHGAVDLILIEIDFSSEPDGTETAKEILNYCDVPLMFLLADTDNESVKKTEDIISYGYVVKGTGIEVLNVSIKTAFKLHKEHQNIINKTIELEKAHKETMERHQCMLSIADGIDEPIYISDTETYEILYCNRALREKFGEPEGRKCYKHLQNRDAPCPFCTNDRIFGEWSGRSYVWEFQNEINRNWYKCIDRAIQWPDGRLVRYEMAVDITKRKSTEEKLQKSKENLRTTLKSIGDSVITTDTEGCIVLMNPAAETITGWKLSDAKGRPLAEVFFIINAYTRKACENPVKKVLESGRIEGLANHTVLIAKNGTERQIADSGAPIHDSAGNITGVVLVFRDVTGEYEARKQIQQLNKRFTLATDAGEIGVWEFDMVNNTYIWDNWMFRLYGINPEDFNNTPEEWQKFVHPDDWKQVSEEIKKPVDYKLKYRIVRRDGEIRCIKSFAHIILNNSGNPIKRVGINMDVTESERAREELQKSENLKNGILQNVPVGILLLDENGVIRFMNRFSNRIFGIPEDEIPPGVGKKFGHIPNYKENESFIKKINDVYKGKRFDNFEMKYNSYYDEKEVFLSFSGMPFINDDKEVTGAIIMYQNILERKQAEEQLSQIQKMDSIGRLAGGVAHDLNNLLTPILGYGELLLDDFGREDERKVSVEEIVHAGYRARDLVHQLLAFSRKQTLEFKFVDLNKIIKDFRRLLSRTIRENIKVEVFLDPSIREIKADIGQLEQVIMNLAVNAQDAMPQGGKMTVETAMTDLDEEYALMHKGVIPGRYVMLAFSDTGCGIDAETCEKIFEPFFTTKEKGLGTGMGLATVYGIVKQHRGNIWVYSEVNEGTTIKCYFPAADAVSEAAETLSKTMKTFRGTETLMIAEDEETVRKLAVNILELQGYTVLSAENGKQCLDILALRKDSLDLLITDVIMPDMNGRELFKKAAVLFPHARVLYMSGYTANVISHSGVLEKGLDFIQKPFSVKGLAGKVREILDQR